MWSGLKTITDYKGRSCSMGVVTASVPEELNCFSPALRSTASQSFCQRRTDVQMHGKLPDWTTSQVMPSKHALTNWQMLLSVIPSCFKRTAIFPVPKKPNVNHQCFLISVFMFSIRPLFSVFSMFVLFPHPPETI